MSFSTPKELRDLVLYWWKILDRKSIYLDDLHQFIAFELFTFPLDITKTKIASAIDKGYLIFNSDTESCEMSPELRDQFEKWQAKGRSKVDKASSLLQEKPYPPFVLSANGVLDVLFHDLMDSKVLEKAQKIRPTWVKLDNPDPSVIGPIISGKIKDIGETEDYQWYNFNIDTKAREITHNCPDYLSFRRDQKKICHHLGKVLLKLADTQTNPAQLLNLVKEMTREKDKWQFK